MLIDNDIVGRAINIERAIDKRSQELMYKSKPKIKQRDKMNNL